MSITFNEVPKDILTPGGYIEFDQSLAGTLSDPPTILLTGHKLAAGSGEVGKLYPIGSQTDVDALAGAESMLAQSYDWASRTNFGAEFYIWIAASVDNATDWPEPARLKAEEDPKAGGVDLQQLIDAMGNDRYDYISMPYYDEVNLKLLSDELKLRFHALRARSGRALIALPMGYTDALAFKDKLNSPFINAIPVGVGTVDQPWRWGAVITAIVADHFNNDPAAPETGKELPFLTAPDQEFSQSQRDTFNHNGLGTWKVIGNTVVLEYLVTTYRLNKQGENDSAYRDTQVTEILKRWRRIQVYEAMKVFDGYKVAEDAELYGAGQKILDPDEFAVFMQDLYLRKGMRDYGWFQAFEHYRSTFIAEVDPDNDDRINFEDQPRLIGQFRVLAGRSRFITK